MILGVLSDTHEDRDNMLPRVLEEFKRRDVEGIVHCGDIEPKHVGPSLFCNIPVICALNAEQLAKYPFNGHAPNNWIFTRPSERVVDFFHIRIYVGHKRSFDLLPASEDRFLAFMEQLRNDNDGLRWIFSGHTHHQVFAETPLVRFVNPGAIEDSFNGYEFAIVNTKTMEIVFTRIPRLKPKIDTFSVAVISDSLKISKFDPAFWALLAKELKERDASTIIHCGNIAPEDIGRPELNDFTVYFNLRPDQRKPKNTPTNWRLIGQDNGTPVVEINDYRFYIQLDLSSILLDKSERDMSRLCTDLRRQHHELDFVLCGFTHNAMCVELQDLTIINPGDIVDSRDFSVICLPRKEITFGRVPYPQSSVA